MKKGTKKFLFLSVATLAGMYAYNQFVASTSTKKNMLPTKNGSYYSWKQGNVFYTKTGTGDPVLLIHDTNSASSSVEWSKISKRLQKKHTVYTMDLLGCGLSDKPGLSYTNYMYVQLIYQRYYKIQNISCSFKPLLLICNYGKSTGCLHH